MQVGGGERVANRIRKTAAPARENRSKHGLLHSDERGRQSRGLNDLDARQCIHNAAVPLLIRNAVADATYLDDVWFPRARQPGPLHQMLHGRSCIKGRAHRNCRYGVRTLSAGHVTSCSPFFSVSTLLLSIHSLRAGGSAEYFATNDSTDSGAARNRSGCKPHTFAVLMPLPNVHAAVHMPSPIATSRLTSVKPSSQALR